MRIAIIDAKTEFGFFNLFFHLSNRVIKNVKTWNLFFPNKYETQKTIPKKRIYRPEIARRSKAAGSSHQSAFPRAADGTAVRIGFPI